MDISTPDSISDNDPIDIVASIAQDSEQEARMRTVYNQVGTHIYQLLLIARSQNVEKLAAIGNHSSLAARRCKQFIFATDVVLGIFKPELHSLPKKLCDS